MSRVDEVTITTALQPDVPALNCTLEDIDKFYGYNVEDQCNLEDETLAVSMITSNLKNKNIEVEIKDTHKTAIKEYKRIKVPDIYNTKHLVI